MCCSRGLVLSSKCRAACLAEKKPLHLPSVMWGLLGLCAPGPVPVAGYRIEPLGQRVCCEEMTAGWEELCSPPPELLRYAGAGYLFLGLLFPLNTTLCRDSL